MEAVMYEGYGPGGVAMLVEAFTDNRNRTGSEIRHAFAKHGGNLGEPGSVAYLFDKKGVVVVDGEKYSEDDLMPALDAGALPSGAVACSYNELPQRTRKAGLASGSQCAFV
jgi:transcriptional/translational regulatory protein YebC/TACO1